MQRHRAARLPNALDEEKLQSLALGQLEIQWPTTEVVITAAARLDLMKRIDTLIGAVASLPKSINWSLIILGEGPARESLHREAEKLVYSKPRDVSWMDNKFIPSNKALNSTCSYFRVRGVF